MLKKKIKITLKILILTNKILKAAGDIMDNFTDLF